MNGLPLILLALAVCGGAAIASFRSPAGVYKRTLIAFVTFVLGAGALVLIGSPFLGDGAGLGVALILYAAAALAIALALSAILGASLRHLWNRLRR